MLALRRASLRFRDRGLISGTARIFGMEPEVASCYMEYYNAGVIKAKGQQLDEYHELFYTTRSSGSSKSYVGICSFHSEAEAKCDKEQDDDSEDGSTELEKQHYSRDEMDVDSSSKSELSGENVSDDMSAGSDQFGMDTGDNEKVFPETSSSSEFTQLILSTQARLLGETLDKWVEEGNEVTEEKVSSTFRHLRDRKMYIKALELSEWLESRQHLKPTEKHYASHIDIIAKVRGANAAEKFLYSIPESFRGAIVYTNLLANCVSVTDAKKSEELFQKMRRLSLITIFAYNQMLLLYKKTDKRKIAGILKMMEKENIKRSVFTYQILIDVKRLANDTTGIEHLIAQMQSEGLEPNSQIRTSLARHYIFTGIKDKAEAVLKEMGGDDLIKNRWLCQILLPLYAALGREDEVERIWKICEPNPRWSECVAAIEAWGLLKRIEKAEAAFEILSKKLKRPAGEHYAALLNVYVNYGMEDKGKQLVKHMIESNSLGGPITWDALVKLFVRAGEVEKADSILENAVKGRKGKPMFASYMMVLDQYAKKGDVENAERILRRIKQDGYTNLLWSYKSVLMAYVNAKMPIYGFWDRLKGDNVVPNQGMRDLLTQNDPFRKLTIDKLLE